MKGLPGSLCCILLVMEGVSLIQGQEDPAPTLAPGVLCYTCGLVETNPHFDKAGSYSNRVHLTLDGGQQAVEDKGLKMYNHSCFQMDTKGGQDVPFILDWEELNLHMESNDHTNALADKLKTIRPVTTTIASYRYTYDLMAGFKVYEDLYDELKVKLQENPCVPKKPDLPNPCQVSLPDWRVFQEKVDMNYNMDMWVKQCDDGIVSCFEAKGDYDNQLPTFRGCAGTSYPHDEKCAYEKQAVSIVEGKKSVDVGVSLCYCNQDLCNLDTSSSPAYLPSLLTLLLASLPSLLTLLLASLPSLLTLRTGLEASN